MTFKVCSKCKEEKPLKSFCKNRSRKDALNSWCKVCASKSKKKYHQENHEKVSEYNKQYHQNNKERILESKKRHRQNNKDHTLKRDKQYRQNNKERILESKKRYYKNNREKVSEYQKKYYQHNREYLIECTKKWIQENYSRRLEYQKQYYIDNPEKQLERNAKRRALKQDSIPEALLNCPTEKDRLEKTYKLRNLLTEATGVEYHVDHIWPLSKGGPHWSGNLQVIPAEENLSKSDSFCEDTARVIQESLDDYIQSIRH